MPQKNLRVFLTLHKRDNLTSASARSALWCKRDGQSNGGVFFPLRMPLRTLEQLP